MTQSIAPSIFNPSSPEAHSLYNLTVGIIILCSGILILVVSLITIACIKFRNRPGMPEPPPVYGNTKLETVWTIIPLITLAIVMFFTVKTMIETSPSGPSLKPDLIVIGHQWWWEVRYPLLRQEAMTANEIHIPTGQKASPLESADVIHDFWVPELGAKIR